MSHTFVIDRNSAGGHPFRKVQNGFSRRPSCIEICKGMAPGRWLNCPWWCTLQAPAG